jgi:crotonobetainyl-CoA:carnitine CoA-transferase CaiB-like acyl-CoA transferase
VRWRKDMMERTAQEWEVYLQAHKVAALCVRELPEALRDRQLIFRKFFLQRHEGTIDDTVHPTVAMSGFNLDHDELSIERSPPRLGEHNDEILASLGYSQEEGPGQRD